MNCITQRNYQNRKYWAFEQPYLVKDIPAMVERRGERCVHKILRGPLQPKHFYDTMIIITEATHRFNTLEPLQVVHVF